MKLEQVAIQLYTLRELCKDEESLHNTLKKVKEIGYQAIQVSGIGPIDPATVAKFAKEQGLVICATHEPGVEIINNPEKVVEKLNILGCDYTAYPYPGYDLSSSDQVAEMITALERSTQVLRNAGKKLCY
jgi:sugar phosphate isomerase/epimerase